MSDKKLLVVLDFNGTILDSTHHQHKGVIHDAMARYKYVYFRPGMQQFISWLMSQPDVEVALWTSNIAKNANALANIVFTEDHQKKLVFTFAREQCKVFPDYSSQKPMQTIMDRMMVYEHTNIIVVDDSPEKILNSDPPIDYYQIPTFEASPITLTTDSHLLELQTYIAKRLEDLKSTD